MHSAHVAHTAEQRYPRSHTLHQTYTYIFTHLNCTILTAAGRQAGTRQAVNHCEMLLLVYKHIVQVVHECMGIYAMGYSH